MKNFRIPQPKELNLCDYCFKTVINVYGSTFLENHYTFCSNSCKENFLKETEEYFREKDPSILIFWCERCKGSFKHPRKPIIEENLIFCHELCADVYFGRKDAFHWRIHK